MSKQAPAELGTAKSLRGRGTYEGLPQTQTQAQTQAKDKGEIKPGQTGRELRETLAARQQEKGKVSARANALIAQAGLPGGINKTLQQPTMDILAVRMQRQAFMFRQAV
jgi:hypothetical protein